MLYSRAPRRARRSHGRTAARITRPRNFSAEDSCANIRGFRHSRPVPPEAHFSDSQRLEINVPGHSYGVRVAQANAARVLDSVQKLILVDPSWGRDVSLAHIENEHGDDGDFVLGGDFAKLDFRPLEKDLVCRRSSSPDALI